MNRRSIARLKQGAIVVNTARGELMDQAALWEAIREGRIAGAGLDVFEEEPIADLAFLSTCPTIITTLHIAWLTPQTIDRSLAVVVENCRRLEAGEPLLYEVRNSLISGI
jgi:phosphoglycerate dehydrogenase-like enzyme